MCCRPGSRKTASGPPHTAGVCTKAPQERIAANAAPTSRGRGGAHVSTPARTSCVRTWITRSGCRGRHAFLRCRCISLHRTQASYTITRWTPDPLVYLNYKRVRYIETSRLRGRNDSSGQQTTQRAPRPAPDLNTRWGLRPPPPEGSAGQPPASSAQGPALADHMQRCPSPGRPSPLGCPTSAGRPNRHSRQSPPRRPFRDTRRGLRGLNPPAHENPSPVRYVLWVPEASPAFASVYL